MTAISGGRPVGRRATRLAQEVVDALAAPLTRPVRSVLVLLAYLLGVAALVAAIGVTQATTGRIVNRLTDAASTELKVVDSGGAERTWAVERSTGDRLGALEGVALAVPVRAFTAVSNTVTRLRSTGAAGRAAQEASFQGHLMVTDSRFLTAHGLTAVSGRLDLLDNSWDGQVVVVGAAAAESLGVSEAAPGVVVWLNGRPVDVVGVLAATGDPGLDDSLYFSAPVLVELSDQLEAYWFVRSVDGYAEPLARTIPLVLAPQNPGQIGVSTVAQLAELQQGIAGDLGSLLGVIGGVILVLSALTAGTTMFLSVQHRAAEIALRRAMGSSRLAIWRLFTYEGVAMGLSGGILGTGLGIVLTWALTRASGWPLCLGTGLVVAGVSVGLLAGAVASIVPAVHAARRDPAGVLRAV